MVLLLPWVHIHRLGNPGIHPSLGGWLLFKKLFPPTQIFIDPLRKVAGSCFVSDLIQRCTSLEQRSFFQALGMCLGYESWAGDWKGMMMERAELEGCVVRVESGNRPVQLSTLLEVSCMN